MHPNGIKIGNAPCSWGVLEFGLDGPSTGPERMLAEMREAGFEGTELGDWGFLPTHAADLQQLLDKYEIALHSAFVPIGFLDSRAVHEALPRVREVVRLLREVGEDAVLVLADENGMVTERVQHAGRIEPGQSLSPEQWEVYARNVDSVARIALEESGISTVFHHHCGGFVETPWEIDALMERTDPDMVGLCLDTGHLEFGGGDSMACLEKWRARIRLVHFKDCDTALADKARKEGFDYFESVRSGVFCELGKGGVAFEAVMKELVRGGYHGWLVVEQDVLPGMGTPLESARRNRQFLEGLIKSSGHC